jgi:hypothetical protein
MSKPTSVSSRLQVLSVLNTKLIHIALVILLLTIHDVNHLYVPVHLKVLAEDRQQ